MIHVTDIQNIRVWKLTRGISRTQAYWSSEAVVGVVDGFIYDEMRRQYQICRRTYERQLVVN